MQWFAVISLTSAMIALVASSLMLISMFTSPSCVWGFNDNAPQGFTPILPTVNRIFSIPTKLSDYLEEHEGTRFLLVSQTLLEDDGMWQFTRSKNWYKDETVSFFRGQWIVSVDDYRSVIVSGTCPLELQDSMRFWLEHSGESARRLPKEKNSGIVTVENQSFRTTNVEKLISKECVQDVATSWKQKRLGTRENK